METIATLAPLALAIGVAGCVAIPDSPIAGQNAAEQGTAVAIRESVWVGKAVATPIEVIEDNRCPIDAVCVQAGRLVVETRIDGPGWRQTLPLTLGKVHEVRGVSIMLEQATPGRRADNAPRQTEYRLIFK